MIGMNFNLDLNLASNYKNNSQRIRVMSESWVLRNVYCPACGNIHISNLSNNKPVADFKCDYCGEIYELKSKKTKIGNKIADGAYSTMIERITSICNPDLFIMQYSKNFEVINLTLIPKFFFVPSIIEKRKPLSENARRSGWVGCNILFSQIPEQGKIEIIKNQKFEDVKLVVNKYARVKELKTNDMDRRGWLLDVLYCINRIKSIDFTLQDIYKFAEELKLKYINNNNIEAKIRQQLQLLRDKGFIEFLGQGRYRKAEIIATQ